MRVQTNVRTPHSPLRTQPPAVPAHFLLNMMSPELDKPVLKGGGQGIDPSRTALSPVNTYYPFLAQFEKETFDDASA